MSKFHFEDGMTMEHVRTNIIHGISNKLDVLEANDEALGARIDAIGDAGGVACTAATIEALIDNTKGNVDSTVQGGKLVLTADVQGSGSTEVTAEDIAALVDNGAGNVDAVAAGGKLVLTAESTGGGSGGATTFVDLEDTPDDLTPSRLLITSADGSSVEHMAPAGRGGILLGAYNIGYDMGPVNSNLTATQVGLCSIITQASSGAPSYTIELPEIIHSGIPEDPQCLPGRIVYISNNSAAGATYTCTPTGSNQIIVENGATSAEYVIKGGQWAQLVAVSPQTGYKHWHVLAAGSTVLPE